MSLVPSASFVLGNFKYDSHAAVVSVSLGVLPAVNSFRVSLPAAAQLDAAGGDTASLDIDGGEGVETVLTGTIASIARGFERHEVVGTDGGAALARVRPAATYEKQAAKDVIRAMASDAGVQLNTVDLDVPLAAYVAHQRRTSAEHVAYLASLAGAIARFEGDGGLTVSTPPGTADHALLYGRELVECRVRQAAAPTVTRFAVGSGPAGSASAPDALRYTTTRLPGSADAPGPAVVWQPHHVLRVPSAAVAASNAANQRDAARTSIISARGFLMPRLRPGMVIEIQELPNGMSAGPWMLTRVEHRLTPAVGGSTAFEAVSAGAGALDLLGALGAAVGGLV
jgi:hypothetical protein